MPFILRPFIAEAAEQGKNFSDPECYTFIGESYIHGIMEGSGIARQKIRRKGVCFEVKFYFYGYVYSRFGKRQSNVRNHNQK